MSTTTSRTEDVLQMLRDESGDGARQLFDCFYAELRAMAQRRLAREREGHTLAPTSLVHETFLRLQAARLPPADRSAFLRLAATVMRHVLIDSARRRQRRSTAEAAGRQTTGRPTSSDDRLVRLEAALHRLGRLDVDLLAVVELRFLVGLDVEAVAAELGRSPASIKRDWRTARAFLQREIERDDD